MTEAENELIILDEHVISKIHLIRGQKVMFDKDLAELYGVEPKRLREQVKRNKDRFPANFFFQLSDNELDALVSQFATPLKTSTPPEQLERRRIGFRRQEENE